MRRHGLDLRNLGIAVGVTIGALGFAFVWSALAYRVGVPTAAIALLAAVAAMAVAARPIVGVYLALLLVPFEYLAATVGGGSFGITPSEGLLLLAAASALPRLVGLPSLKVPPALWAFGALIVISFTGLIFAIDSFVVIRITLMWSAFAVVALLVSQSDRDELMGIIYALGITAGILGVMALAGLSDQESTAGGAIVQGRAQGGFNHPTALAMFLIMIFPLTFAAGLAGPKRMRPLMLLCGTLAIVGLLLTHTRGSVVGGAIALLVMLRWASFRRIALTALLVLAVVVAFDVGSVREAGPVSVVGERLSTIGSLKTRGDERTTIWATTPEIIIQHPLLGVGQGNFHVVSPHFGLRDVGGLPFDHAHNLLLNITAELGVLGLMALIALIVLLFQAARRALRDSSAELHPFALAIAASLCGLAVNSITEYPLRQNVVLSTIVIVIAILLALDRIASERPTAEPNHRVS